MEVKYIAGGVLILALVGGGFYYKHTVDTQMANYETQIAEAQSQINDLQTQINYTGELTTVYELAGDVHGGTPISSEQLREVQMPKAMTTNCPHTVDDYTGKYYLFDIKQGQVLSYNQMMDFEVDDNMRELDVVLDTTPIGLEVGDYVDINISFTMGQNFTGITHKRVLAINGNVLKLVVDPKDVYVYESMKVDRAMYNGTSMYAVKYVEGTAQLAGRDYYPVRLQTMTTLVQDPNVTMDFSSLSTANRTLLENQLNTSDEAISKIMTEVASAKTYMDNIYTSAKMDYDRVVENELYEKKLKQKQAEEQAEIEAKAAAEAAEANSSSDSSSNG